MFFIYVFFIFWGGRGVCLTFSVRNQNTHEIMNINDTNFTAPNVHFDNYVSSVVLEAKTFENPEPTLKR